MNLDRVFILAPEANVSISKTETEDCEPLIYIRRSTLRVQTISVFEAEQLRNALMAVLSGQFDHAFTEEQLRADAEEALARQEREAILSKPLVLSSLAQPELDSL